MKLFAHYFAGKGQKFLLISDEPSINDDHVKVRIEVDGKADARKHAAFYDATPWNF